MKGSELRRLRRNADLFQQELAHELGISDQTISNWEVKDAEIPILYSSAFRQFFSDAVWVESTRRSRKPRKLPTRKEQGYEGDI